jgi:hypothetical protein
VRVYQEQSVSIEENSPKKEFLKAFPNPAKNHLNIDISALAGEPESLAIYSMDGQKIKSLRVSVINQQLQIKLGDLAPGGYVAIFELEGLKQQVKFIKE